MRGVRLPGIGAAIAILALAAASVAGCGGGAAPAPPHRTAAGPWLYVWRNFELTGIPEEISIARDGSLRYRNLLHTQKGIAVRRGHLSPAALAQLRRLLGRVDLAGADSAGVRPARDGYRWVIRYGGRTGTAADGHLHGAMRPLVDRLRTLMDRLQTA